MKITANNFRRFFPQVSIFNINNVALLKMLLPKMMKTGTLKMINNREYEKCQEKIKISPQA
jgi:hypothetical protein